MSKTFCPLPWIHLSSHPNGMVSLCCQSDHVNLSGFSSTKYENYLKHWTLNRDSFDDIHNSESFKSVRLAMLDGAKPKGCRKCWEREQTGSRSKRLDELDRFPTFTSEIARSMTDSDGTVSSKNYKFIELRLGNVCNLRCVTCNPVSSNMWQSDYDHLSEKFSWMDQGMRSSNIWKGRDQSWVTDPDFWNRLLDVSDNLELIYINGGEPTHNAEHIDYLEKLVARDLAKNITLWYSTNVTYLPERLITVWSKFKKIEISASIDHINERNEFIRFPSKWSKTQSVIKRMKDLPNLEISVLTTVSALNFLTLDLLAEWTQQQNLPWWVNHVWDPEYLSVFSLPKELRKSKLRDYLGKIPPGVLRELEQTYLIRNSVDHRPAVQYLNELDKIRNTDWKSILPELAAAYE